MNVRVADWLCRYFIFLYFMFMAYLTTLSIDDIIQQGWPSTRDAVAVFQEAVQATAITHSKHLCLILWLLISVHRTIKGQFVSKETSFLQQGWPITRDEVAVFQEAVQATAIPHSKHLCLILWLLISVHRTIKGQFVSKETSFLQKRFQNAVRGQLRMHENYMKIIFTGNLHQASCGHRC